MPKKPQIEEALRRIQKARKSGTTSLWLSDLGLTELPDELFTLYNLSYLGLDKNQLTTLPESLANLSNLSYLDLSKNQLTTLPESLANLSNLTRLSLSNNQLSSLPDSFSNLSNFSYLDLSKNQLTTLPDSFANLSNLTKLDLRNNQLSSLPDSFANLSNLTRLDLDYNQLTTLPDSFGNLSNLFFLDLDNNQLTTLPDSLANLSNLIHLSLGNNPKLGIPPEILNKKPADILRYYFLHCSPNAKKRPLNEAKLLLVGQGGVGKTSLVKRLTDNTFDEQESKTEGINIKRWEIGKDSRNNPLLLNVWDFGGQEIMHATHQFFLTKRSLYLLVIDARQGETEGRIEYWLKIIQSFGGDSPVIVVINKIDAHQLGLNETYLKDKYKPNLCACFPISCKNGSGIDELKAAILSHSDQLPHVHDELLESWFNVKNALETLEQDVLPFPDYQALCKKYGVTEERDQGILIRYLHDLGIMLNYADPDAPYALRDLNILNPEWVTGAIYKIINSNLLFHNDGVLEAHQLPQILDSNHHSEQRYPFILGMMEKFELCFDFPEAKGKKFLLPELLKKNQPELNWPNEGTLNFEYHYEVLPSSVLSRFIVRQHHNLTEHPTYWRYGVILKIDGCRALVRSDETDAKIFVSIKDGTATGRRGALAVIRNTFREILATIPALEYLEKVPLPGLPKATVSYRHLLELERLGDTRFLPEGRKEKLDLSELLDGIIDKAKRGQELDTLEPFTVPLLEKESSERQNKHPTTKLSVAVKIMGAFAALFAAYAVIGEKFSEVWRYVEVLLNILFK